MTWITDTSVQLNRKSTNVDLEAHILSSLFARAKYSYENRDYLSAVIRRDGSSRFGPNNCYGVFPGVSALWRISGEGFMEDQNVFRDLKLRASFDKNGNQEIRNYVFASTYGYSLTYNTYSIGLERSFD